MLRSEYFLLRNLKGILFVYVKYMIHSSLWTVIHNITLQITLLHNKVRTKQDVNLIQPFGITNEKHTGTGHHCLGACRALQSRLLIEKEMDFRSGKSKEGLGLPFKELNLYLKITWISLLMQEKPLVMAVLQALYFSVMTVLKADVQNILFPMITTLFKQNFHECL